MTLISAMRFNSLEGAMVADEMISDDNNAYITSKKLLPLRNKKNQTLIIGATGDDEVIRRTDYLLKQSNFVKRNIPEAVNATLKKVKKEINKEKINGKFLNATYLGLYYNGKEISLNVFSTDKKDIELFIMDYKTLGGGAISAEQEIHYFFESLTREQREEINPAEGLMTLLCGYARARIRSIGVGGIPLIYAVNQTKIFNPSEDQSKLAEEIAMGVKKNFIPKKFGIEAIENLIYHEGDSRMIEQEIKKITDWDTFDRYLRGYRGY